MDGTITRITTGSDATSIEVTVASGKPLVWTVPNLMLARLGYEVGCAVRANVDGHGNLRGVRPAEAPTKPRPFKT